MRKAGGGCFSHLTAVVVACFCFALLVCFVRCGFECCGKGAHGTGFGKHGKGLVGAPVQVVFFRFFDWQ